MPSESAALNARCTLDPTCEFGPHDPSSHPCGRPIHEPDLTPEAARSVQRWMTEDLFLAVVGTPEWDFDEWYDRKGFGDAWAALCAKVRETFDVN